MNTIFSKIGALTLGILAAGCAESDNAMADRVMETARKQALAMHESLGATEMPRTLNPDGSLQTSGIEWWCSGFFPGTLWNIYRYSGNETVLNAAREETAKLLPLLRGTTDHDVGFQVNCSFGEGYRLTDERDYKRMMLEAADTLAARFNPVVGCIRSWNKPGGCYVIIDNMMNLELLMEASRLSGNERYKEIAIRHAETTARNHIRPDFSSFHWVVYNDSTGQVKVRKTGQGYADNSTWARGEAWALYGYAMMASRTGDKKFLSLAENIARWILKRLPSDGVPYWDYTAAEQLLGGKLSGADRENAGEIGGQIMRDASAGAVTASGLLELSTITADKELAKEALSAARKTLHTLASPEYLAEPGTNGGFLLKHSTGHYPARSEVDMPLTYADYYFLEAINKLVGIDK